MICKVLFIMSIVLIILHEIFAVMIVDLVCHIKML